MSFEQWARLLFEQVESLIIADTDPTRDWRVRVGDYLPEGYRWDGEAKPIADGDLWGRPDGGALFEGTAVVPERMAGSKLWLRMLVAGEVIVHANGRILDGLDPNRERVLLAQCARAGERIKLTLEAYSRSKPDDERNLKTRASRGCVQAFNIPHLAIINEQAQAISHDLKVLFSAAFSPFIEEGIRDRLQRHLTEIVRLMPPYECPPDELAGCLPRLREYLSGEVFNNSGVPGQPGGLACVAHSHLDIAYHWRVIQSIQKNARTCLIQLRLMDRHPEFLYSHSQSWTYEMLEKYYPELFEEVRQRIAEGRWEIVGGMYVEPDCNLISAESFVRQILYGKRYFLEKFGVEVDNCWLPDVFGNSAIMPQILKAGGIDYFVSNKMSTWNDTNGFPHNNFLWRGLDGTEISACVPPVHFISWLEPGQLAEHWQRFLDKDVCDESLHMYGYGDGGSGVTDEMIEHYQRVRQLPGLPRLRLTTGKDYLHAAFANPRKLGTWDGELYLEMHRGTFTTKADLKRENRRGEFLAYETEALCVLAALDHQPYPAGELVGAWKKLLLNQFHDILPGSHTHPVAVDAMETYAEMRAEFNARRKAAVERLTARGGAEDLCVFNPFSFPIDGTAIIEESQGIVPSASMAESSSGDRHSLQWQQIVGGGERLVIEIGPVAPLAFTNLKLMPVGATVVPTTTATPTLLENDFFRVELDSSGRLVRLFDKSHGQPVLADGAEGNDWQLFEDRPGMYNAWDLLDRFEDHPIPIPAWESVEVIENGPVSAALRLRRRFGGSTAEQIIRVFSKSRRLDFETFVDWQETERILKVAFPLNVKAPHYETDTTAGVLERPNHRNTSWEQARFEVCCHKWVRMGEGLFGVSLLNESKYGCDVRGNVMRLSLLRAPIRPDRTSDKGRHFFTYSLFTDGGSWQRGGLVETAYGLNWPLSVHRCQRAPSSLTESLLQIESPSLFCQSLKLAEDGSGDIVLRLVELHGSRGTTHLRLNFDFKDVQFCDLLERPTIPAVYRENVIEVAYEPCKLVSLRCIREQSKNRS